MKFLGADGSIGRRFPMARDRPRTTSQASDGDAREAPERPSLLRLIGLEPRCGQSRPRTLRIVHICQLLSQTTYVFLRVHLFSPLPNKFFLDINFVLPTIKETSAGSAPALIASEFADGARVVELCHRLQGRGQIGQPTKATSLRSS